MKTTRRRIVEITILAILSVALLTFLFTSSNMVLFDSKGSVGQAQSSLIITSVLLMAIIIVPVLLMSVYFPYKYRHSNKDAEYFGVNTAEHFVKALADIAKQQPDALIFGGDLTQDHSFNSYLLFAELIHNSDVDCPVFWVPGNHDEIEQLNLISGGQIQHAKHIVAQGIELILINSKGDTPAGWVSATHLDEIMACLVNSSNRHIAFCHHNPLPINGYLDKHMLENGPQLLNLLVNN